MGEGSRDLSVLPAEFAALKKKLKKIRKKKVENLKVFVSSDSTCENIDFASSCSCSSCWVVVGTVDMR